MSAVRVLHVENDSLVARAVARVLKRLGFSTLSVGSCDAARTLKSAFDVGVFDVDLGDGNGVQLAEELLTRGTVSACLFFTGTGNFRLLSRAASNGGVVRKQAGVEALAHELAALRKGRDGNHSQVPASAQFQRATRAPRTAPAKRAG